MSAVILAIIGFFFPIVSILAFLYYLAAGELTLALFFLFWAWFWEW